MRLPKASLSLTVLFLVVAFASSAKADQIVVRTAVFPPQNRSNDRSGLIGMDSLVGAAASSSGTLNGTGSFLALLSPLTISSGVTGVNSSSDHLVNISIQVQTMNLTSRLDISDFTDSFDLLSVNPIASYFGKSRQMRCED